MTSIETTASTIHKAFQRLGVDKNTVESEYLSNPRARYNLDLTAYVKTLLSEFYAGDVKKLDLIEKAKPIAVFSSKSSKKVELLPGSDGQLIIAFPRILFARQTVPPWFQKEQVQGRYSGVKVPDNAEDRIIASRDEFAAQLAFAVVPWLNTQDIDDSSKIGTGVALYQAVKLLDKLGLNPEYAVYAYAKSQAINTPTIRYQDLTLEIFQSSDLRPGESLRTLRTALVDCRYENRGKDSEKFSDSHTVITAAQTVPETAYVPAFLKARKYSSQDFNGKIGILADLAEQGDLTISARRSDIAEELTALLDEFGEKEIDPATIDRERLASLSDNLVEGFTGGMRKRGEWFDMLRDESLRKQVNEDWKYSSAFEKLSKFCRSRFKHYLGKLRSIEEGLENFIDAIKKGDLAAAEKVADTLASSLSGIKYRESPYGFELLKRLQWPEFDIEIIDLKTEQTKKTALEEELDYDREGHLTGDRVEYDPWDENVDPWDAGELSSHPVWDRDSDRDEEVDDFEDHDHGSEKVDDLEDDTPEPVELVPWNWLSIDTDKQLSVNFIEVAGLTGMAIDARISLQNLEDADYRLKLHLSEEAAFGLSIYVDGSERVAAKPWLAEKKREYLEELFRRPFEECLQNSVEAGSSQISSFAGGLDISKPEELNDQLIAEKPEGFFQLNLSRIQASPAHANLFFEKLLEHRGNQIFYQELSGRQSSQSREIFSALSDYFAKYKHFPEAAIALLPGDQFIDLIGTTLSATSEPGVMGAMYVVLAKRTPGFERNPKKLESCLDSLTKLAEFYPQVDEEGIANIQRLALVGLRAAYPEQLPPVEFMIRCIALTEDLAEELDRTYHIPSLEPVGPAIQAYIEDRVDADDIQNPTVMQALQALPHFCRNSIDERNIFDSKRYSQLVEQVVEKSSELSPAERANLIAGLMNFASVSDPRLRKSIQNTFCRAVLEEHGADDGSNPEYLRDLKDMLEEPFKQMGMIFRIAIRDQLTKTLNAQLEASELIHDLAESELRSQTRGKSNEEEDDDDSETALGNLAVFGGNLASFLLHVVRSYPESSRMITDFLTSKGDVDDVDRFRNEVEDFVLDKKSVKEDFEKLQVFDFENLYYNFWGQTFQNQVLLARELYFPKETAGAASYQAAFGPAMQRLTAGSPYQQEIMDIADEYIESIDFARRDLVVTAALLAGRNTTTTGDVGQSLAMFFAYSGVAETVFGQRLVPFLPESLSKGMGGIKHNAKEPNRLEQNQYLRVVEPSLLRGFNQFLAQECSYTGNDFFVKDLGPHAGAASICSINRIRLSNGSQSFDGVIAMQHLGALSNGQRGFAELTETCNRLNERGGFNQVVNLFSELLPLASERLVTETNCTLAREQFALGQQMFCNREAEINGRRFISDSVPVYACGKIVIDDKEYGYYLMPIAPGEVFDEWLKKKGDLHPDLMIDAIMFDLTINWIEHLALRIEADRHAGNKFFDPVNYRMTQIDMKAIAMNNWEDEPLGINQLGKIMTKVAGTEAGFEDIQQRVADAKGGLRAQDGKIYPLVNEEHCALQAQADGMLKLPQADRARKIQTAFLSALWYAQGDWPLVDAMIRNAPPLAKPALKSFVETKDLGLISNFTGIKDEDLIKVKDQQSTLFPHGLVHFS